MDLVQLACKKFGKLTRAETKLFKAVAMDLAALPYRDQLGQLFGM